MKEETLSTSPEIDYRQLALDLAGGELTAGGRLRLRVIGDSMAPLLWAGDYVLVAPVAADRLQRGDLVVVLQDSDVITHRIISRDKEGWLTKGDNRRQSDLPCRDEKILGRVITVQRGDEIVNLKDRRARLANRLLGLLGAWEATVFNRGAVTRRMVVSPGAAYRLMGLARMMARPFGLLRKLIYKAYKVESL